jgi:hypothetical protein
MVAGRVHLGGAGHEQSLQVWGTICLTRHRRTTLDHLEECLLLAEQVILRTENEVDRDRAQAPSRSHLAQGALHGRCFCLEASLQAQIRLERTEGVGGDGDPLEELIGVVAEEKATFDVPGSPSAPLQTRYSVRQGSSATLAHLTPVGKSSAAASAEARSLDFRDDRARRHR